MCVGYLFSDECWAPMLSWNERGNPVAEASGYLDIGQKVGIEETIIILPTQPDSKCLDK